MVNVSSEEKYRNLFTHLINGFAYHKLITDKNGVPIDYEFLEVNPAFEKMTGLKSRDLIGKKVTEVISGIKKDPANWIERYGKVALTKKNDIFENYTSGLDKWFKVSAYSTEKGYFATVFEDITDLKRSEERFHRLADNATDVIFRMSVPDGKYEYISPSAKDVFGYSPEEFYKTPMLIKKILAPNWRDYFKEQWLKIIKNEILPIYEYQIVNKLGEIKWINQRTILVRNEIGKPIMVEGIATDITERKNDELQVKKLLDFKNNFIKIVSHQLKTPLEIVRWTLASVLTGENGSINEAQEKFIRMAVRADALISSQLNDLLTVMDIEEKRMVLDKSRVQIESILQLVFDEFKQQAKIKRIKMTLILPKVIPALLEIDGDKIKEVFRKLIDNAIIYTREKGKVVVKLLVIEKKIRFEVGDNGVGIPKNEQSQIFNYFFRASNAKTMKEESSGVGLNIVKYFIEAHGGKISFASKEGKGTTFWFELPIIF